MYLYHSHYFFVHGAYPTGNSYNLWHFSEGYRCTYNNRFDLTRRYKQSIHTSYLRLYTRCIYFVNTFCKGNTTMPSNKPIIAVRTTEDIIKKFSFICEKEKRSMSKQAEKMIIELIESYESEHGKIRV